MFSFKDSYIFFPLWGHFFFQLIHNWFIHLLKLNLFCCGMIQFGVSEPLITSSTPQLKFHILPLPFFHLIWMFKIIRNSCKKWSNSGKVMFSIWSLYGSGLQYGLINAHIFTQTVSVRLHFNVGIKPSVRNLKSKCHKGFLFFLSKILSTLWFAVKIYVTGFSGERMCILSMWNPMNECESCWQALCPKKRRIVFSLKQMQ